MVIMPCGCSDDNKNKIQDESLNKSQPIVKKISEKISAKSEVIRRIWNNSKQESYVNRVRK
jgi:hypothetical protein